MLKSNTINDNNNDIEDIEDIDNEFTDEEHTDDDDDDADINEYITDDDNEDELNKMSMYNYNEEVNNLSLSEMLLFYENQLRLLDLNIKISTITITANNSLINFNIENIGLYCNEFDDILIAKIFNKQLITINSISNIKIKQKNAIKRIVTKGNFLNQISFIFDTSKLNDSEKILLTTNNKKKKINLKLFKNGSIQCTGFGKKISIFKKCIEILFDKLKKPKAIYKNNKFIDVNYVEQKSLLVPNNIHNFVIRMININFLCDYNINRSNLHSELKKEKIIVDYDPNDNVSVNIKYKLKNDKYISIMVFESGSISITGANSCCEIDEAYKFINSFIYDHTKKILIKPVNIEIILNLLRELDIENNKIL